MQVRFDPFIIDLRDMPAVFWRHLGEAKSKVEHIDHAPLLPEFWTKMHEIFLVKGVQATTAIEGNTLSEDEVLSLYRRQLTLPPSRQYLGQEVQNVLRALNEEMTRADRGALRQADVERFNERVLADLELLEGVVPGCLRSGSVVVGRYRCPSPAEVPALMHAFVDWYNAFSMPEADYDKFSCGIVKAIAAHLYFVLIHPFGDGNGRTARFLEWRTLDDAGVPSAAGHLLSNHYNLTRTRYYEALDQASLGGDLRPFFVYAMRGFVDQLVEQLRHMYQQYQLLVFGEMVRQRRLGTGQELVDRRRELAGAILRAPAPVATRDQLRTLTPTLAAAYSRATDKTLSRDLHALEDAGLIQREAEGWTALLDTMYWRHRRRDEY